MEHNRRWWWSESLFTFITWKKNWDILHKSCASENDRICIFWKIASTLSGCCSSDGQVVCVCGPFVLFDHLLKVCWHNAEHHPVMEVASFVFAYWAWLFVPLEWPPCSVFIIPINYFKQLIRDSWGVGKGWVGIWARDYNSGWLLNSVICSLYISSQRACSCDCSVMRWFISWNELKWRP